MLDGSAAVLDLLDIVDIIFELLRDDKATLRSCSLTCRGWSAVSQQHLFASVVISQSTNRDFNGWSRAFPSTNHSPARYVRQLKIVTGDRVKPAPLFSSIGTDQELSVFQSFSNVQKLTLACSGFGPLKDGCFDHLTSTLQTLILEDTRKVSHTEALNFVSLFPTLEDLTITTSTVARAEQDNCVRRFSPKFQGTLRFVGLGSVEALVQGILKFPNGVHFRSLEFTGRDMNKGTSPLVSACAQTLENLELVCSFHSDELIQTPHDLQHHLSLRQIRLTISVTRGVPPAQWISRLLGSITSPHFTTVSFGLSPYTISTLPKFYEVKQWKEIDDTLAQKNIERGGALQVIIRHSTMHDPKEQCFNVMAGFLPRVAEMGIMEVIFQ